MVASEVDAQKELPVGTRPRRNRKRVKSNDFEYDDVSAEEGDKSVSPPPPKAKKARPAGTGKGSKGLAGFTEESVKELDLVALRKKLSSHVKCVARMVDADWHDGYEEQDEEIMEWYAELEAPLNAIHRVARTGTNEKGYERLNKALLIMADSWVDMKAIPKRTEISDCIYDSDTNIHIGGDGGVSICGPDEVFHWVWRAVLISACKSDAVGDEAVLRIIKDASDYDWRLDDEELKDQMSEEPTTAVARLTSLVKTRESEWKNLPSNYKVHNMRRAIDRRFDGPKHRRTRDYDDDHDDECAIM